MQFIFVGRSNAGKSLLLKSLFPELKVRVSGKQGSTSTINMVPLKDSNFLVDLPGYGYTLARPKVKRPWMKMFKNYLEASPRISKIFWLINLKHGLVSTDLEFLEFIRTLSLPIQVVFTKCDTIEPFEIYTKAMAIGSQLAKETFIEDLAHIVSAKQLFGIEPLRASIGISKNFYKPRPLHIIGGALKYIIGDDPRLIMKELSLDDSSHKKLINNIKRDLTLLK